MATEAPSLQRVTGTCSALLALLLACACSTFGYQVPPGVDYVTIPAGSFQMGQSGDPNAYQDEWPLRTVSVNYSYAIGRYEVTTSQYAAFLNSVGVTADSEGNRYFDQNDPDIRIEKIGSNWSAKSGWENYPMAEVSWYGADAYCRWMGGRLPTEEEWEKASRGSDARMWPWGNEFLPSGEDVNWPNNPRASYWWGNRKFQSPPVKPYPVGTFSAWPSPYGLHDTAGNLWEWTIGGYDSYPGGPFTFFDPTREVQRGGSWTNSDYNLRCAVRSPQAHYTTDANLGLRVVWSDYEPSDTKPIVPPRQTINEWVEDFNVATSMDQIYTWWQHGPGTYFTIEPSSSWLVAGCRNTSNPSNVGGEFMAMIRRDTGSLFVTGDYVDITVRLYYERGDRGYARSSVGVAWGDTTTIVPGGRGADENFGYPWYLIANSTDIPGQWNEVTCKRIKWEAGKLCIGFGLWGNLSDEAIPPIHGEHRTWVDWVRVRHSKPDYPFPPTVTDDGQYTNSATQLHATWGSPLDPYPIVEYQYAIGTSPSELIVNWKSAGTATQATESGLSLQPGLTYYWYVKARYDTMWSDIGSSDGIKTATPSTISDAKTDNLGIPVLITGAVVTSTATDPAGLWVASEDRVAALKAQAGWSVSKGQRLSMVGTVAWEDGIPVLNQAELVGNTSGSPLEPLGMNNKALANDLREDLNYIGTNPVGLLVTTWGKVTAVDTGTRCFYVDDGTGRMDGLSLSGSPYVGVRVSYKSGLTPPASNKYVLVTGIRSIVKVSLPREAVVNGEARPAGTIVYVPVLSVSAQSDIVVTN